jgi:hypothetical protein
MNQSDALTLSRLPIICAIGQCKVAVAVVEVKSEPRYCHNYAGRRDLSSRKVYSDNILRLINPIFLKLIKNV